LQIARPEKDGLPSSEMPADSNHLVNPHGDLGTSRVISKPIPRPSISKVTNRSLTDRPTDTRHVAQPSGGPHTHFSISVRHTALEIRDLTFQYP
jgi:hypothetical protein